MMIVLNRRKRSKDWFRIKRYPHIGTVLKMSDRKWIEPYVKNSTAIQHHAFFPFVHRSLRVRKFRRKVFSDGTRSIKRQETYKIREIYYSNHLDSNIYSYYSELLSAKYEVIIDSLNIGDCITAYRRVKLNPEEFGSRNKCNIDFANDVISFIKNKRHIDLIAVTFDIKNFFDCLDHKHLKRSWKYVLNAKADLPPDHYNVYRNITKYSFVEENDLFDEFRDRIIVEREPNVIKKIPVNKKQYLRDKRAIAYCTKGDIEVLRKRNLIKANKYNKASYSSKELRTKGIPQGSPISSLLANVYMLDFDLSASQMIDKIGGLYKRYSDDMVAVFPPEHLERVLDHFQTNISQYKLEIQESKTKIFMFRYDDIKERHFCSEKSIVTGKYRDDMPFQYLGFQFDGLYTLIKNSSISGYYRKMKRSFAHGRYYTYHNNTKTRGELFKSKLYKRYTYVGSERRRIYQRQKGTSDVFTLSYKYDWGNFLTYAKMSASTIQDNKVLGQLKGHWKKFHKLIDDVERRR